MTEVDEVLALGPRRSPHAVRLRPVRLRPVLSRRAVRAGVTTIAGAGVLLAAAVLTFAAPVIDGHGSAHVVPRPEIVQPLKGDFLS